MTPTELAQKEYNGKKRSYDELVNPSNFTDAALRAVWLKNIASQWPAFAFVSTKDPQSVADVLQLLEMYFTATAQPPSVTKPTEVLPLSAQQTVQPFGGVPGFEQTVISLLNQILGYVKK